MKVPPVTRWFRRPRLDRELEKELRFHVDQHVRDLMATGLSRADAERRARLELGGVDQVTECVRESRSGAWLDRLRCDTRDAWRGLKRAPGSVCAAIVLIGLVIGGNTTIFSMIHGILTKPARGVQANGLVTIGSSVDGRPDPGHSYLELTEYLNSSTVRSLFAEEFERFTLTLPTGSFAFRGGLVTANYFDTLGVSLIRGRTFTHDEELLDASGLVAVVSYRVWQDQFHGAEDVLGQVVRVNGHPATVIGVAAEGFQGAWLTETSNIWVPLVAYTRLAGRPTELATPTFRGLMVVGQLAPGVSLSAAREEFNAISKKLAVEFPQTNRSKLILVLPYSVTAGGNSIVAARGSMFLALFSVITLLTVLIVCANVANLMLARAAVRQRETAVRHALGASRAGLVRVLLIEGLMISGAAWAGACLLATWTSRAIVRIFPPVAQGSAIPLSLSPDFRVIAYAMGLALVATVVFTLPAALRGWRQDVLPWLKPGEHGIIQGRSRLAGTLVILQLSLAVLLLTSAGLAFRSTSLIGDRSVGFETSHLVLTTVNTAGVASNETANREVLERLRERLQAVAGVRSVTYARSVPSMPDRQWRGDPVRASVADSPQLAWVNTVGTDYLRALGLSPIAGRELATENRDASGGVALINQDLANALWPGESPIGRTIHLRPGVEPVHVVGVAPNALFSGYPAEPHPKYVFLSQSQEPAAPGEMTFYIRHSSTLDAVAPAIGRALKDVDANIPIVYMRSLDTELSTNTWAIRFISVMLMLFAGVSLLIAAIGQYAVVAFDMKRRTRDFGIRIALGASRRQLLTAAIREGLRWTTIGLFLGFVLSVAAGRAFRSVLFGVTPTDSSTYLAVFLVLALTSLAACYLPARWVSRINPIEALRQD